MQITDNPFNLTCGLVNLTVFQCIIPYRKIFDSTFFCIRFLKLTDKHVISITKQPCAQSSDYSHS